MKDKPLSFNDKEKIWFHNEIKRLRNLLVQKDKEYKEAVEKLKEGMNETWFNDNLKLDADVRDVVKIKIDKIFGDFSK